MLDHTLYVFKEELGEKCSNPQNIPSFIHLEIKWTVLSVHTTQRVHEKQAELISTCQTHLSLAWREWKHTQEAVETVLQETETHLMLSAGLLVKSAILRPEVRLLKERCDRQNVFVS